MGKNNPTHAGGQKRWECPECDRSVRLTAPRNWKNGRAVVHCGRCGNIEELARSDWE